MSDIDVFSTENIARRVKSLYPRLVVERIVLPARQCGKTESRSATYKLKAETGPLFRIPRAMDKSTALTDNIVRVDSTDTEPQASDPKAVVALCTPVYEPHSLLDVVHLAHYALVESAGYNCATPDAHKYSTQGRLRDMTVILLLSHTIPTLPVPTTPRQVEDTVLLPDEGEHFLRLLRDKQATLTVGGDIEQREPFIRVTFPDSSTFVALWLLTGLAVCFKTPSENGQHFLSKTSKLPMSGKWAWESLQFFTDLIRKHHAAVKTTEEFTLSEPS